LGSRQKLRKDSELNALSHQVCDVFQSWMAEMKIKFQQKKLGDTAGIYIVAELHA